MSNNTGIDDKGNMFMLLDKARQAEIKACNVMHGDEQKVIQQRDKLETCLKYREESLTGLKYAKSSGLSVVQVRECQILVQYLDTVVDTWQYKTDICEEKHEKSKALWQKKSEDYIEIKEKVKNLVDKGADEKTYAKEHEKLLKKHDKWQKYKEDDFKYVANYRA